MAAKQNIDYYSGQELSQLGVFTVTDGDGDPVDLSGQELELHVKKFKTDSLSDALIILKTSDQTLIVTGVDDNEVVLNGVHQIDKGKYYQDLFWADVPDYIWEGDFMVKGNVTRQ